MTSDPQTVTVRVTTPNKALQFIVGAVVICLIWKAWRAGWAYDIGFDVFNRSPEGTGDGMGSVTGAGYLIILAVDAVCLLGMASIALFSGLWTVVMDLAVTAKEYIGAGRAKLETKDETSEPVAVVAKPDVAPDTAGTAKKNQSVKDVFQQIDGVLVNHEERMTGLEQFVIDQAAIAKPAAKSTTRRKSAGSAK